MNKRLVFGLLVLAGCVFALTPSKPAVQDTTPLVSAPSDSTLRVSEPGDNNADTQSGPRFAGAPCTFDCSGHEAGYNWAEEHKIDDESECDTAGETSNSPSFADGCKAYVAENDGDASDDDDEPDR